MGLVPASLLLGPVVRAVNPLRLQHDVVTRLGRIDPERGLARLPDGVGYWPAGLSLLAFGAMELVVPGRAEPPLVAAFVTVYAAGHLGCAVVFGRRWFDRGDGFEVYSALLGSLAPIGRRADGRPGLRNPIDGLDVLRPGPGLVGLVVVLVGTTAYDGLSGTSWWVDTVPLDALSAALGLLGATLAVGVIYLLGSWSTSPQAFATTLAPIAAGCAIAHYFSLLVFDGQQALILAGDPLGMAAVDYRVVGPVTILVVQLGALVVGHLVASGTAHDRALRLHPTGEALRTQYPMLGAMVVLTVGAVGLLFAA